MPRVEFFYDIGSPWTYLAFHKIEEVAREGGAELVWKPILVGGVFNAVNPEIYEVRARARESAGPRWGHMAKDLADWSRLYGLEIVWPPSVFPVNSVKVMRGALVALDEGRISEYSRAGFEAYWRDDLDLSRDDVVGGIAERAGLDAAALLERIARQETRDRLRANTDELVARGGFGSPTIIVDGDDLYFGNDRLDFVRRALARAG